MALAFILQYWKPLAIAAAFLALFGWHKLETRRAFKDGIASEQTKARIEAGKRITEMETNDEAFRKLPALERCRAFMRDSGLSIDHCDQR
jgi:hypothetical protein